jgi:hypothetical protein
VIVVNQVSEASNPSSYSALCPPAFVVASSSIFRTHFQVPYPATLYLPLL